MYTIHSRSSNKNEPIQGRTESETKQKYVEYRRWISGTSFDWQYYAERGYEVRKLPKFSKQHETDSKLV